MDVIIGHCHIGSNCALPRIDVQIVLVFLTPVSIFSGQVKLLAHECVPHYYSLVAEGTSQISLLYAGDDFV